MIKHIGPYIYWGTGVVLGYILLLGFGAFEPWGFSAAAGISLYATYRVDQDLWQ